MNETRAFLLACAAIVTAACGGCTREYYEADFANRGLVVILPGIQGEDSFSHDVRSGLVAGSVNRAVVIERWGNPAPVVGLAINQVNFLGARLDANVIAGKIIAYQNKFPDRPVHVVGHSGGGAVAVFIAESLLDQRGKPLDGLVLLSPSLSSIYDLTKALRGTRHGVMNCYNPQDGLLLGIGTTIVGNLDGLHAPSAGLNGFVETALDSPAKKEAYRTKLFQQQVPSYGDPHFASTNPTFISGAPAGFIKRR